MKKKILAIIPARSGSKRLPGKNSKIFHDKPLIAWTIEAALNANSIDKVLVSTDSHEIKNIAIEYGAEAPFLRPQYLAEDETSSLEVIKHAYSFNTEYEHVMLLQPTSPLRTAKHIDEAANLFFDKNANSVVSITSCEHPIIWSNYLNSDLNLCDFMNNPFKKIDTNAKKAFRLNGAIYMFCAKKLTYGKFDLYDEKSYGYEMPVYDSVDIDTVEDFEYAEYLLAKKMKINESSF